MTVTAESAKRKEDGVVVISKQKLVSKSSDLYVWILEKQKNLNNLFALVHFMNYLFMTKKFLEDFIQFIWH